MSNFYKGICLIILSVIGFGLMPIFALYAYKSGITVTTLLLIRFTAAALIMFIYIFIKIKKVSLKGRDLLMLFLLGGVCYTLQSTFYFSSVRYIPASLAALILYTYPAVVAVLTFFVDGERLTGKTIGSILISFAGLVLILGTSIGSINLLGVLFAAGASFVYSCYIVLGNKVVKKLPSIVTSGFVMGFTALGLLLLGLSTGNISFDFDIRALGPIVGLIFFSTILAILTFFRGLELLGPTKASIISVLEPVVTAVFSAILFHEVMTVLQLLGGLVVLLGAAFTVRTGQQHKPKNDVN
ncbi:MAG: DMT family transporter [Clostridia bacterium]|nr:DMT family transporter [Clostridia bacterium]